MKYISFDEWYANTNISKLDKIGVSFAKLIREYMHRAWDAAMKNYPVDEVKNKINELQAIIDGALKIECTCDQISIKMGFPCVCVKAGAVVQSMNNLSKYLIKLKEI